MPIRHSYVILLCLYVQLEHTHEMIFEWDENKNISNICKHGINFETAKRIFEAPILSVIDDRLDYGEVRQISIGMINDVLILVVVHTDRSNSTRLISARKANKTERIRYEKALRQKS